MPEMLPTVRLGSKGGSVRLLQSKLKQLRFMGPGVVFQPVFDRQTEQAIKDYQRFAGLTADGIVGPKTWAALFGRVEPLSVPEFADLVWLIPAAGGGVYLLWRLCRSDSDKGLKWYSVRGSKMKWPIAIGIGVLISRIFVR